MNIIDINSFYETVYRSNLPNFLLLCKEKEVEDNIIRDKIRRSIYKHIRSVAYKYFLSIFYLELNNKYIEYSDNDCDRIRTDSNYNSEIEEFLLLCYKIKVVLKEESSSMMDLFNKIIWRNIISNFLITDISRELILRGVDILPAVKDSLIIDRENK